MLKNYVIQLNFYKYLYSLKDYINLISINKLSYKNYNYDTIYKYYLEKNFQNYLQKQLHYLLYHIEIVLLE